MVIDSKITHKHHVLQRFPDGGLYLPPNLKFRIMFRYAHFHSMPLPPASAPPPYERSFTASAPPDLSDRPIFGARHLAPERTPHFRFSRPALFCGSESGIYSPNHKKGVAPRLYLTSKGRASLCFWLPKTAALPVGRQSIPLVWIFDHYFLPEIVNHENL